MNAVMDVQISPEQPARAEHFAMPARVSLRLKAMGPLAVQSSVVRLCE